MALISPSDELLSSDSLFSRTARELFGNIRQHFKRPGNQQQQTLYFTNAGVCRLSRIQAPAHEVDGSNVVNCSFDIDNIKVLLQLQGKTRFDQNNSQYLIERDSIVIYDPTRAYTLQNKTVVDQVILQIPRTMFDNRMLTRLNNPVLLPSNSTEHLFTLASFIKTAISTAEKMDKEVRASLGLSLAIFVQGVVTDAFKGEMLDIVQQGSASMLKTRITEYIEQNLTRPELTVQAIAKRMGCSNRYLHKAFEDEEITLHNYIQEKRLDHSFQLLTSPQNRSKTISEIAFSSGFNSSAHFCRSFKKRFNKSPNQLRKEYI